MFEVYFRYEPRTIVVVDWKDIKIRMNENCFYTVVYGIQWDWKWNQDYCSNPLAYSGDKQENVMELNDMEDAIKKLFGEDW
jgi:hypothetical protein